MIIRLLLLALTSVCLYSSANSADLLDSALALVGKSRNDLGYQPKGYWNRYPFEIPYKLPAFDDLFAEPLRVYDYSQSMKSSFATFMDDTLFADTENSALYQLTYQLAWERRIGGFRSYSPNLIDSTTSDSPLVIAIEKLYAATGFALEYRTFGAKSEPELSRARLVEISSKLSPDIQRILALWISNIIEAKQFNELAFRNVSAETMREIYEIQDLDATQGDGQKYYPQFDDCAAMLDWQSLVYSSFKVIAASDITVKKLRSLPAPKDFATINIPTPLGRIVIGDTHNDSYRAGDYLLICDFGGNDNYADGAGSRPWLPISAIIDLGGDDIYGDSLNTRAFGYGVCGTGVLLDASGNDHYHAHQLAQGCGIFGTGLVADFEGNDDYRLMVSGQGCGYFGVGMLVDRLGDDNYYLAGDGQGAGSIGGGIGILADYRGNDHYVAEPYSSKFNRGDYHSQMTINANNAQGWGGGRRGDGSDGHSWAGGMGVLIDCFGDDSYYSGNWTLGVGYWFGIGILFDVEGNDIYRSCYFTQASGAHYCIGALFDETGNDKHELFETAGAGLSFGWDFAVTLMADWKGNDTYIGKIISIANAQIRSNSLLFDFGGNDLYQLSAGTDGMGDASFREDYRTPRATAPFLSYAQSFGILLDVGGVDRYIDHSDSTGSAKPRAGCADNTSWLRPAKGAANFGFDNFGIGMDVEAGIVEELFRFKLAK
ncbi:MAG: hypothetical protein WBP29_01705 [Candidatus Zixiibacteriota bacterium]